MNAVVNSAATSSHYPFDNAAPQAGDRFANLSALYDEVTCRHLDRFGIGAGWRCLEVGAGGGSIARFMSERVGARGHVVATDINTDWITGSLPANVELRRHDIGIDPLPEAAFDVVHARAVLTFVPERRTALTRMIAALKPDGWLLDRGDVAADHRGLGPARRTRCRARPQGAARHHGGGSPRWRRSDLPARAARIPRRLAPGRASARRATSFRIAPTRSSDSPRRTSTSSEVRSSRRV